jgi:hypothetical protein
MRKACAVGLSLLLGGCATGQVGNSIGAMTRGHPAKVAKASLIADSQIDDELAKEPARTHEYETSNDPTVQFQDRNAIIFTRLNADDRDFNTFEWGIWGAHAGVSTLSDWAVLGLTAAGTLASQGAAQALSAAAAGVTGAKTSAEKNFLYGQTMSSLLVAMELNRGQIKSHLVSCLQQPTASYSLFQAQNDESAYWTAGNLPSAVARLAVTQAIPQAYTASCGGAVPGANVGAAALALIGKFTPDKVSQLELVMSSVSIDVPDKTGKNADQELAADVAKIKDWMLTAGDVNIEHLDIALQAQLSVTSTTTPQQDLAAALATLAKKFDGPAVTKLETAMRADGIQVITAGNFYADSNSILLWVQTASPASSKVEDLAKTVTGIATPPAAAPPAAAAAAPAAPKK